MLSEKKIRVTVRATSRYCCMSTEEVMLCTPMFMVDTISRYDLYRNNIRCDMYPKLIARLVT